MPLYPDALWIAAIATFAGLFGYGLMAALLNWRR